MNLIEAYTQAEVGDRLCIGIETGYTFYIKEEGLSDIKIIIKRLLPSEVIADNWFIKKKEVPVKQRPIYDNELTDYLKQYIRDYKGLPYWSLSMGIIGVMMGMGWQSPEDIERLKEK